MFTKILLTIIFVLLGIGFLDDYYTHTYLKGVWSIIPISVTLMLLFVEYFVISFIWSL